VGTLGAKERKSTMSNEKNTSLFFSLVMTFQAAAMQQMGILKNPISDKIESDLQQAQISIDILDMLEEKTRGNLSEEEIKLLKGILQELKLNYVDEMSKEHSSAEKK
jgi:hypothetical protein